jgi:hypothetical protein
MRTTTLAVGMLLTITTPAAAQVNRVYLGTVTGVNGGGRGPVDAGSVWTAGGVVGIRVSGAWSIEFEADRGFGTSERQDRESVWISYAAPGSSREEIERLAVRAMFVRRDVARSGFSAHAVWKSREPGRLNAALYGGVSQRNFDKRVIRTITHVPDDPSVPRNDPNVRDDDSTRTVTGGGLTGGVMVLARITDAITVAPDFRLTLGLITDESTYKILNVGVRVMWGF